MNKRIKNQIILAIVLIGTIFSYYNDRNEEEIETGSEANGLAQYELYVEDYADIVDVVMVDDLNEDILLSYEMYEGAGWDGLVEGQSEGTKAGGYWGNYEDQLPEVETDGDEASYREFDVNDKIEGSSRDAMRFVISSEDLVYYTDDHYETFVLLIE